MDVRLVLDERLRAVAVVHIPIDDEHAIRAMRQARVVRRERDVAENAEAHRRIADRVMPRRTHGGEAAHGTPIEGHVHRVEHAAGGRGGREPRALARDGVGVELPAARERNGLNSSDIFRVVHERELLRRRVPPLVMQKTHEELGALTEGARDRAQPPDVLGRAPPCRGARSRSAR